MARKTYMPQFAKEMHYLGKYVFEHREKLYVAIDTDADLDDDQKMAATKIIDDILAVHPIYKSIHRKLTTGI